MAPHRLRTSSDVLRAAIALFKDHPTEALTLLEDGFQEARRHGDKRGASSLARHAGVLSTTVGDLGGAQRFYEEALKLDPTDPGLHLAVADICERLSDLERAAELFAKAEQLANSKGDKEFASGAARRLGRVREALSSGTGPDSSE